MISLAPVPPDAPHLVAGLRVRPEQEVFSGQVSDAFDALEPDVDFHCILQGDDPVGFFKIDRAYARRVPVVPRGALGLRAFLIDHRAQGKGLATQAVKALPDYLHAQYPQARCICLTVNLVNAAAIRTYLKGGFRDTGIIWPHGQAGPQHVMRMALSRTDHPIPRNRGSGAD